MRLRHVQNNLFASDCQYFHNEKTFVRTTEVQQCVLITKIDKITKIALFLYCISLKLHCSQPIRIEIFFSCILLWHEKRKISTSCLMEVILITY